MVFYCLLVVVWLDVDNDGDMDFYVGIMVESKFFLYINDGMGYFKDEVEERGVVLRFVILFYKISIMIIVVGDYDRDGWLDVYIIEWFFYFDFGFDYKNYIYFNCCLFRNFGV